MQLCDQSKHLNWPTEEHVFFPNITIWKSNITEILKDELGKKWEEHKSKAAEKYGRAKGLDKNPLAVTAALESAWGDNLKSSSLIKMIEIMLGIHKEEKLESDKEHTESEKSIA